MADSNCNDGVNDGPSKVKTKACRFFHTKRGCKFGYECQFLHSAKTSSQSGNVVNEGDEFVTENEVKNFEPDISLNDDSEQSNERLGEAKEIKKHEDSSQDRRDIACKFFQRKRGCMRGSKCPFVHVLVDGQSAQTNKSASDENVKSTRSRTKNTSKRKKLASPSSDKEQDESKLTKSSCLQLAKGDQKPIEQGDLPVQKENADNTMASQGSGVTVLTSNKSEKHVETKPEGMHGIKCNTADVNTGADCNKAVKGSGNNVVNHVKSKRQPEITEKGKRMESKENIMRGPFNERNRAVFGTESTTGIPPLQQDTSMRGSVSEHGGSALKNGHEVKHEQYEKGLPLSQKNSTTTSAVTRKRSPLQNKEYERTRERNQTHNKDNCASNFRGSYTLADAMLSEPKKLRATEIQQLKRRFGGKGGFIEMKENSSYRIKFKPTDPDWQFKIEAIYLTVCFPDDYPLHMFDVALFKEQDLSEDIINFVNERLKQWTLEQEHLAKSQGFLKLFFRPFLHWLDKNLVSFFVDGGSQIGAKYVSNICGFNDKAFGVQSKSPMLEGQNTSTGSAPREEYINDVPAQFKTISDSEGLDIPHNDTEPPQNNEDIDRKKEMMDTETTSSQNSQESFENDQAAQSSQSDIHGSDSATSNTAERGTQIQFKGLNLEESISSIRGNKVVITFECKRCRQRIDLHLSPSGCTVKQCTRCASVFAATYRPAIIHQFSSILGYLDLDSCVPFDVVLPESELMLGCFQCSKETSVKGLQYGANWSWCGHCHHKLRFQIESTRFHQLQSSALDTSVSLRRNAVASSSSKSKKPFQSSGLKEGQPLPANGTCKHYKKSFRWLRFPCCGKCYPCDLCHEEEEDHEMKYATRMVCGFCSREQILKEGKGRDTRPDKGQVVTLQVAGHTEDGKAVDWNRSLEFILGEGEVIQAFDLAVALMELEEVCELVTDCRYAYGKAGKPEANPPIPADAKLTYELHLLAVRDGPNITNMTDEERITIGEKKREIGNNLYTGGDYAGAINSYQRAIKYLSTSTAEQVQILRVKCWNNMAAAQLKIKAYSAAEKSCSQVLQIDPDNVKALFRKGKVLAGNGETEQALVYIKKADQLDPNNKTIRGELNRIKQLLASEKRSERTMYQRMLADMTGAQGNKKNKRTYFGWPLVFGATVVALGGILMAVYLTRPH